MGRQAANYFRDFGLSKLILENDWLADAQRGEYWRHRRPSEILAVFRQITGWLDPQLCNQLLSEDSTQLAS